MSQNVRHTGMLRRAAWFVVPAAVPLVVVLALSMADGVRALESMSSNEFAAVDPDGAPLSDPGRNDAIAESWSRAKSLEAEEAFLAGKLDLAASKEASLWIDLTDSTITIAIEGVPVRVCRVSAIGLSAMLIRMQGSPSEVDSLRAPFVLESSEANIPHIPIRVVEAPKDTAEARLRPPDAFTPEEKNVTAVLQFDRRLVVHLLSDDEEFTGLDAVWQAFRSRTAKAAGAVARIFSAGDDPLEAEISIRMSSNDVRAVYRSLRQGSGMTLRLRDA